MYDTVWKGYAEAIIEHESFNFAEEVLMFERALIRASLQLHRNSTAAAAKELGLTRQGLTAVLDKRHLPLRAELGITKRTRRKRLSETGRSKTDV